jgi:DNA polymerase/3'-5' exonuclease PolX
MSKGKRAPLGLAQTLGGHLIKMLAPFSEKIEVVGSVRRMKPMVGDVEIVTLARETHLTDLFGQQVAIERTTIDDALDQLADQTYQGWRIEHRHQGRKHKRLIHIHTELKADLYIVLDKRAWGSHVVVRTGPRGFSTLVMTEAQAKGFHFADGFLLHGHMKTRSGCRDGAACEKIIPLYEEIDVFNHLGMRYMSPEVREDKYGSAI